MHGFEMMKKMHERQEEMKETVNFLDGLVALREGMHTDILVKAGNGRLIPAHRAVLVRWICEWIFFVWSSFSLFRFQVLMQK